MSQLGQAPRPSENGSFLQRSSVPGLKVQVFEKSTIASSTITLNPTGDANSFDYGYFNIQLFIRFNGNTVDASNVLAKNYARFAVDGTNFTNTGFQSGLLLTAAQKKMTMGHQALFLDDGVGITEGDYYYFKNNDSSSHTIYLETQSKFMLTAGETLSNT